MPNPTFADCVNSGNPLQSINLQALPPKGTPGTLASSGTISHNGKNYVRVTTGGAVTGVIMQKGRQDGQLLIIENVSANSITFATAATSFVRAGTSAVIAANSIAIATWNNNDSRWTFVI